jgi:CrcB protein
MRITVLLAIALGGAGGALLRYGLSHGLQGEWARGFPVGTLAANVLGCLAIGLVAAWLSDRGSPELRMGIQVGLLGALTTFSTFSLESLNLMHERHYLLAAANVLASVALSLAAVYGGILLGRAIFGAHF